MKKLLSFLFGIAITIPAWCQANYYYKRQYITKFIDFTDSVNAKLVQRSTDNLATILVDGYLTGKLKGYSFSIGEEVLKRGPIPAYYFVPWEADKLYFPGDRVYFNKKFYEAVQEFPKGIKPTDNKDYWYTVVIEGDPVSTRYFFPLAKDTLTKKEFLIKMISQPPVFFEPWNAKKEYYTGEVVDYAGFSFEALKDVVGKVPIESPNEWQRTRRGEILFFEARDFKEIEILYSVGKSKHEPQTIAVYVMDWNMGAFRSVGLNFLFDDAVNYLNLVHQPLLYKSDLGFLGTPEVVQDDYNRINTLKFLKTKLASKEIKPNKKSILDGDRFKNFLSDVSKIEDLNRWKIMQTLANELVLGEAKQHEFDYEVIPFLRLSNKELGSLFGNSVQTRNYQEMLLNGSFNARGDSTRYDSLSPRVNKMQALRPASQHVFYENFKASISLNSKKIYPSLGEQAAALWKLILQSFYEKKISPRNPMVTLFPCRHDWSGMKLNYYNKDWHFDKNFGIGPSVGPKYDSLPLAKSFKEVFVVYKRKLTSFEVTKPEFLPVEVSITLIPANVPDEVPYPVTLTFDWATLRLLMVKQNSQELNTFIKAVESGTLNFYDSTLTYGLVEEN